MMQTRAWRKEQQRRNQVDLHEDVDVGDTEGFGIQ